MCNYEWIEMYTLTKFKSCRHSTVSGIGSFIQINIRSNHYCSCFPLYLAERFHSTTEWSCTIARLDQIDNSCALLFCFAELSNQIKKLKKFTKRRQLQTRSVTQYVYNCLWFCSSFQLRFRNSAMSVTNYSIQNFSIHCIILYCYIDKTSLLMRGSAWFWSIHTWARIFCKLTNTTWDPKETIFAGIHLNKYN